MAKKTNVYGAGSWDTTTINGKEYVRYRKKYESINLNPEVLLKILDEKLKIK